MLQTSVRVMLCALVFAAGCGRSKGGTSKTSTFDATFPNGAATNATTAALNLTFVSTGGNGSVTASAAFLGTGMTIIWSDGGASARTFTIDTTGTPAAGQVYNTDATQGATGNNTFTYKEGDKLWDGTGTITIVSTDTSSTLVDFTADMAMQPDASSPGGATGTFTVEVTSSTAVFGL
jgi:hypothetical protein